MMTIADEYGLDVSRKSLGLGMDGAPSKGFTIKPAVDPSTRAILEAREAVLKDRTLTRSMKAFYCWVLDKSLDPEFFHPHPRGIVTLSDTASAEPFGVSERTIYTWKFRIEDAGYWWLSRQFRKNMWPITTYHLACLHPPKRGRTDRDGTYGRSGAGRPMPQNPGLGARKPGQPGLPLPGSRQAHPNHKTSESLAISGEIGDSLRPTPEADFGSEPKPTSGESRSPFRLRAEASFGREPKFNAGHSRTGLPTYKSLR